MEQEYIGVTYETAPLSVSTPLVDPATRGAAGPCVGRRMDEDYWRQILTEHRILLRWVGETGKWVSDCNCAAHPVWQFTKIEAAYGVWVEHILNVAAHTPEQFQGDPIPDGVPSTLLTVEPEE
jgi:hypothetical protein